MNKNHWLILLLSVALIAVSVRLVYALQDNKAETEEASAVGQMSAIDCIMTRTSVRKYTAEKVSEEDIETILRAGMAAPTAVNKQPWEFVVVTDKALKDSIASSFKFADMAKEAQVVFVVCGNADKFFEEENMRLFWTLDCSAATENMLLATHAIGLGGVWCGIYPKQDSMSTLKKMLNLPDRLVPFSLVVAGHPAAETTPKNKWNPAAIHYKK